MKSATPNAVSPDTEAYSKELFDLMTTRQALLDRKQAVEAQLEIVCGDISEYFVVKRSELNRAGAHASKVRPVSTLQKVKPVNPRMLPVMQRCIYKILLSEKGTSFSVTNVVDRLAMSGKSYGRDSICTVLGMMARNNLIQRVELGIYKIPK